ncbi:sodium:solute symporter family transporter [Calditrichota bacterium GD2]
MSSLALISIGIFVLISVVKSLLLKGKISWLLFAKGTEEGEEISVSFGAISIFTSLAGGFMVFGIVQVGFEGGISGYIFGAAYVFGMPLLAWSIPKVMQKVDIRTGIFGIDKLIFEHYGTKSVIAFYIMTVIVFSGVLGGQFLAVGFYLKTFTGAMNYTIVLGIGLFGTFLYTYLGGFKAVLQNDWIQGLFVICISFIFPFGVLKFALNASGENLLITPLSHGIGGEYGVAYPLVGGFFLVLSFIVRPDLWQRIRLVNEKKRKYSLALASIMIAWFYFAMTSAGIIIRDNYNLFPMLQNVNSGEYMIRLLNVVVEHNILKIFVLTGIIFALLSSIDSYLNLVALALTRSSLWSQIPKFDNFTAEEKEKLFGNARVATIAVAIIAGTFAMLIPNLVHLLSASFSVLGILIPVAGYAGLSKTRKTADWIGALTLWSTLIILIFSFPFLQEVSFIPSVVLGNILFFILIFLKKRPA